MGTLAVALGHYTHNRVNPSKCPNIILGMQNGIRQKGDKRNPLWYDLSGIDVTGDKDKIMSNHAHDDILNYVVDKIQKLAPDEQEWLLENLIDLVRERITNTNEPTHSLLELEGLGAYLWKEAYSEYLYEEALHHVKRLKPEYQLELFKFLAGSVLQKARIGPQHNVMEFRGAAKDFWQEVDVKKYYRRGTKFMGMKYLLKRLYK